MTDKSGSACNEAEKEQLELEKKRLRVEMVGSGACTMEGFEAIWNIIRGGQ